MRAIILTAGKGNRLYPLTKNTPKCLLKIFNGHSILESQVNLFREYEIDEIVIVTGFLAHQIEQFVELYSDIPIITVHNPFYLISNSIVSCWLAREYMDDDFLLINGDTVIHQTILEDLLKTRDDICLAVSSKEEYDDDDMKVILDTSRKTVKDVSKQIPAEKADGESIGFFKFQRRAGRIYQETIEEMFRNDKNLHIFHHNVIRQIIMNGKEVAYLPVDNALWEEVDFSLDITLLRNNINLSFLK
ncbi:MAG TPA: phosphocholine cytidylyltransferase family protein [Nitrospirae bacterium]|nr:phosphocholine cytidylyltransferase family protein [Nitrospirota bacterium]